MEETVYFCYECITFLYFVYILFYKRFFTLNKNGKVSYFYGHKDETPIAEFSVKHCTKIIKSAKIRNGIILCTAERNWKFICLNDEDRNQWMRAFEETMNLNATKTKKNLDVNSQKKENGKNEPMNKWEKIKNERIEALLANSTQCGNGKKWWKDLKVRLTQKFGELKFQQHAADIGLIKGVRNVAFWSQHSDKYRIIMGSGHRWREIHHGDIYDNTNSRWEYICKLLS